MSGPPVLVVGLGHPDRGDDAVGGAVAREVGRVAGPGVEVLEQEDPTDLVLLWEGRERVVVVDAVSSGGTVAPGTVHVLRTGAGRAPIAAGEWSRTGRGGTHAFGLAGAVELARALGRLPNDVTVVGVEVSALDQGAPLTPVVASAVPTAALAVLDVLAAAPADAGPPRGAGPRA
jgi:hydrogenase maturation protease